jgi:peptidoglycan/xylan/chitin deacetylase (PgdA/CDA1 family)
LDVILQKAKPIAVGNRIALTPGIHYVGVTFDDGFNNFAEVALPELAKRHIPSTMFVISGAMGKAFGPQGHPEAVMTTDQIRNLPQDLVTIGSHTVTHPFLPAISEQQAEGELRSSRTELEVLLNRKVLLFSFPFGGFNGRLVRQCREAGYERIFTTLPQMAFKEPNEFAVGRVRVDPDDWPLEFRLKLAGAYRWLPWAFVLKRKVMSLFRARTEGSGENSAGWLAEGHSAIQEPDRPASVVGLRS